MIQIRPAERADLTDIATIHALAWHAAYAGLIDHEVLGGVTPESRLAVWQRWFDTEHHLHVCCDGADTVGFIRVCPARDHLQPPRDFGELTHLYLHPSRRATGLGHRLFEFAVELCRAGGYDGMLLWTLEGNAGARRFYESHGMIRDGARADDPDWLGPGVYEIRYQLRFDEP